MKISKKVAGTACITAMLAGAAFAQEDFGGFEGGDFGTFEEESSTPTLTWNGEAGVDGRMWLDTENGYDKANDVANSATEADAYLKLEMNYSGENTDLNGKIKLDSASIKDNPEDVIDEFTARGYFGNWQIEAGKMKTVWGKGDKLHVLDNFNANDYTDFIFPEYIDRRIAEPMVKIAWVPSYAGDLVSNIKVEGVYTPMMTADRFATSGQLVPYTQTALTGSVTKKVETAMSNYLTPFVTAELHAQSVMAEAKATDFTDSTKAGAFFSKYKTTLVPYGLDTLNPTETLESAIHNYVAKTKSDSITAQTKALMNASGISSDPTALYADTHNIRYGQAGLRVTGTVGSFDLGASYYYGHYKQPTVDYGKVDSYIENVINGTGVSDDDKFIDYDELQVFGLEAAFLVWKFNTRWEFAYNLTRDFDGTNPYIKNNSIAWVGGFDMDLPIHNVNINIQETGKLILKNDEVDKLGAIGDTDYNSDGKYTNNQLVINISDKWLNEKLTTECTTIYGIECKEWCVQPKVSYNVVDGLTFTARGAYIYADNANGQFYNFTAENTKHHRKAFVQLSAKYQF
ncbi:hypothetical protein [Treponema saccharophilum]|uniref:Uncharacterized protein n=1 Tax=Treponema saccharophilum DSM 2985 TaxID=907348 RepID=H7EK36_9SPIR|nr:hypothetical protein [Treponema saccharophilum]EIC02123.1 hypothetical protein TresaDRAFT_1459 [Treponema saccharophilum DSM 2985]BDC96313.1 hypothetical protein TRSA_14120 [Treponema saccharophilum]